MYKKDISIEQIEHDEWAMPDPNKDCVSGLILKVHALRRKPLSDFTIEDIRLAIGQKLALSITLPMALEALANDILAEGDMYEGDLLNSVLNLSSEYWDEHAAHKETFIQILQKQETTISRSDITSSIKEKVAHFKTIL